MITKGKWEVRYAECPIIVAVSNEETNDIAHLDLVPNGNIEVQANARLIAAAPDLYAVAKESLGILNALAENNVAQGLSFAGLRERLVQAKAKAEGKND